MAYILHVHVHVYIVFVVSSKVDATPKSGIKRSSDAGTLEHNIPHR